MTRSSIHATTTIRALLVTAVVCLLASCSGPDSSDTSDAGAPAEVASPLPAGAQTISLLGEPLYPPEGNPETRAEQQEQLQAAQADLEANPDDPDALIWVGRRYGYLAEYRRAIEIFSHGIERFPGDARFYRHRGHRYISVRELDNAIADFRRAAELVEGTEDEVEPDGQPNALGIPTSTLQFNIWYHYGLALYLKGEFRSALTAYGECVMVSGIPDKLVATSHWLYMTLRRLGQDEEAAQILESIHADMEIIENHSYHSLLLMYKGEITPEEMLGPVEDPTPERSAEAYGVGNWYLYNGQLEEAKGVYRRILLGKDGWAGFGYIAAEADMARLEGRD